MQKLIDQFTDPEISKIQFSDIVEQTKALDPPNLSSEDRFSSPLISQSEIKLDCFCVER